MEKYRKCDGCGLTFRDPGNRTWTWTTRDYAVGALFLLPRLSGALELAAEEPEGKAVMQDEG